MRRIALIPLVALLVSGAAIAQVTDFSQRGVAQELNAVGKSIAHASLPLNSQAKVVNILTGKEIDVTVTGRIPMSPNRIADLSPDVWQELDLAPGAEVRIYTVAAPKQRPAATTPPVDEPASVVAEAPPEPAPKEDTLPMPLNITVNLTTIEAREAPKPAEPEGQPVQPQEVVQPAPVSYVQPVPQPAAEVIVIPGLPNPATNKVYRLQVGAFSALEAANRTAQDVASLRFQVVIEQSGSIYRVLATDVPAALVQYAAQRLALAGIREIWVRE